MKYEGVIFDLDGTLANTLEDLADSMNKVLTEKGYPALDYESYKSIIGKGVRNLVIQALPEAARTEEIITGCYKLMLTNYKGNCLTKTTLYDGIVKLVNNLREKNIKLAVLSNKDDELTKRIMENFFNASDFEVIIGAQPGIPSKPDPAGALLVSRRLDINPGSILYLGDTEVDMITAGKAGMFAVGVLWGFRSKSVLLQNGAKMIIKHPLELLELTGG